MKRSGATLRVCVFLLIALVLTACGSETPATPTAVPGGATQPTAAPPAPTTAAATATTGSAASGGDKTIVFIPKATNATYWLALLKGAQDAGKELGYNILYQGTAAQTDIAGQVNIVNDMVSRKVSGILLAATDAKALVPPVEQAIGAGVPVITVDSGVDSDKPYAYIASDNVGAAKQAADTLGGLLGGKGTVGDIGILAGSVTGREREDGFVNEMKAKYPAVKVLPAQYSGCDPAKALNIATDLLTGNPELNGYYGACDAAGTGAGQLVKQRGLKGQVKTVSFDVSPDEFQLFLDGYVDAMVVQDPYSMGYQGVQQLDKIIKGGQADSKQVAIPAVVVTHANLQDPAVAKLLKSYPDIEKLYPK